MDYIDSFRDRRLAEGLAAAIAAEAQPGRSYRFMEFCGGHTHAIARYGVADLLPASIRLIHGPGCPVCVLPIGRIDQAITLAQQPGITLCTYADTLRVPASGGLSLHRAKAAGAEVRLLYSVDDALALARREPSRQVVFFAIGFETTTPPTAVAVLRARAEGLSNFSVLCCHVLTPPAMAHLLAAPGEVPLDGFIGPAHVSTVIGSRPYETFADDYRKPVAIAGFEPLDVMRAVHLLIQQVNAGVARVDNEFSRAVSRDGNRKAQAIMDEVFELREDFDWRGLGSVAASARRLRPEFAAFDAEQRFALPYQPVPDHRGCECGAVLRGEIEPAACKLFGTVCTPENPIGACMVSSEGACAAHYTYGRLSAARSPA